MNIYKFYRTISPYFRRRRFENFLNKIMPTTHDKILDVGGYPRTWNIIDHDLNITIYNLNNIESSPRYSYIQGDARDMPFADNEFDIVFSNSVIEHLGSKEDQTLFAKEVMRVGNKYWVQTPAYEFFIEPHYIAPFIHWLPKKYARMLIPYFSIRAIMTKLNKEEIEQMLSEIRLLKENEFIELFPHGKIYYEKFLLMVKSYTITNAV